MARFVSEHKVLEPGEIYIEEGWELVREGPDHRPSLLALIGFIFPGEEYIKFEDLRKRAITFGAYAGKSTAVWLFDNQDTIPIEWRRANMIFPATLLRDLKGSLRIPVLTWIGEQWIMIFSWRDEKFNSRDKLVYARA